MLVKTKARILGKEAWTTVEMSEAQAKAYWKNYVEKVKEEKKETKDTLEATKENKTVEAKDVVKK